MKTAEEILKEKYQEKYAAPVYEDSALRHTHEDLIIQAMQAYHSQFKLSDSEVDEKSYGVRHGDAAYTAGFWDGAEWMRDEIFNK